MFLMILQSSSDKGCSRLVLPKVIFWNNTIIICLNSGCVGCSLIISASLPRTEAPLNDPRSVLVVLYMQSSAARSSTSIVPNSWWGRPLSELKEKLIHWRCSVCASLVRLSSGTAGIKLFSIKKQQNCLCIQIVIFFLFMWIYN